MPIQQKFQCSTCLELAAGSELTLLSDDTTYGNKLPARQMKDSSDMQELATWVSIWSAQQTNSQIHIPSSACKVTTPLVSAAWYDLLINYPSPSVKQFFMEGLLHGFHIGFDYSLTELHSVKNNMHSALERPYVVDEYLRREVIEGRVAGPFRNELLPKAHTSRFGVIPKSHQPNKWRLIVDLSFPKNHSVNAGISSDLCSLTYVTIEDAIRAS